MTGFKKVINWTDETCIRDIAEAIRTSDTATKVAQKLDKLYLPASKRSKGVTRSSVLGAIRRPGTKKAMERLFPQEANALLKKFEQNNLTRQTRKQIRPPRNGAPLNFRSNKPKLNPAPTVKTVPLTELEERKEVAKALKPLLGADGRAASLDTLNDSMCSYPIGEPGSKSFGYCGRARTYGAFCADHGLLSYVPISKESKKRQTDRWLESKTLAHAHRTKDFVD